MRSKVFLTPLGPIAELEDGRLISEPFSRDPVDTMLKIERGEAVEELRELLLRLVREGVNEIVTPNSLLHVSLNASVVEGVGRIRLEEAYPVDYSALTVRSGLVGDEREYYSRLREVLLQLTEAKLKVLVSRRDVMIVHAIKALDDLDKQINMLYGRLVEWYGLHFPELKERLNDPVLYATFISTVGRRANLSRTSLSSFLRDERLIEEIMSYKTRSLGTEIDEDDESEIRSLAGLLLELNRERNRLERYVRTLIDIEAPNVAAIAGPIVGARLICAAGGLEKLARLPASTIQVLGAEKALFRFFRTGRGAPKHGIIFQHPYVHTSPKWLRGKIARALATKISIAARIDYFTREDRSAELRGMLEKRITEIREKYREPPTKRPVKKVTVRRGKR